MGYKLAHLSEAENKPFLFHFLLFVLGSISASPYETVVIHVCCFFLPFDTEALAQQHLRGHDKEPFQLAEWFHFNREWHTSFINKKKKKENK